MGLIRSFKEKIMDHLEFEFGEYRLCLTGTVITIYKNGNKVRQYFFDSKWEARIVFLAVAN